jgi:hypothetical protein
MGKRLGNYILRKGDYMSYDLSILVKIEGLDRFAVIDEPRYANPTYNLSQMFRACMDWDYSQSDEDENGVRHHCYYRCDEVLPKIERGIKELRTNRKKYEKYEPENGYGTLEGAIRVLESLRDCIYQQAEEIPLGHLYMSW